MNRNDVAGCAFLVFGLIWMLGLIIARILVNGGTL